MCTELHYESNESLLRSIRREDEMTQLLTRFWNNDEGQDIAEYALMLAVILVIVIGAVQLIGTRANTIFSRVANALQ